MAPKKVVYTPNTKADKERNTASALPSVSEAADSPSKPARGKKTGKSRATSRKTAVSDDQVDMTEQTVKDPVAAAAELRKKHEKAENDLRQELIRQKRLGVKGVNKILDPDLGLHIIDYAPSKLESTPYFCSFLNFDNTKDFHGFWKQYLQGMTRQFFVARNGNAWFGLSRTNIKNLATEGHAHWIKLDFKIAIELIKNQPDGFFTAEDLAVDDYSTFDKQKFTYKNPNLILSLYYLRFARRVRELCQQHADAKCVLQEPRSVEDKALKRVRSIADWNISADVLFRIFGILTFFSRKKYSAGDDWGLNKSINAPTTWVPVIYAAPNSREMNLIATQKIQDMEMAAMYDGNGCDVDEEQFIREEMNTRVLSTADRNVTVKTLDDPNGVFHTMRKMKASDEKLDHYDDKARDGVINYLTAGLKITFDDSKNIDPANLGYLEHHSRQAREVREQQEYNAQFMNSTVADAATAPTKTEIAEQNDVHSSMLREMNGNSAAPPSFEKAVELAGIRVVMLPEGTEDPITNGPYQLWFRDVQLKAWQPQAIAWLYNMWQSPMRSGILSDDVGTGKTLVVECALVLWSEHIEAKRNAWFAEADSLCIDDHQPPLTLKHKRRNPLAPKTKPVEPAPEPEDTAETEGEEATNTEERAETPAPEDTPPDMPTGGGAEPDVESEDEATAPELTEEQQARLAQDLHDAYGIDHSTVDWREDVYFHYVPETEHATDGWRVVLGQDIEVSTQRYWDQIKADELGPLIPHAPAYSIGPSTSLNAWKKDRNKFMCKTKGHPCHIEVAAFIRLEHDPQYPIPFIGAASLPRDGKDDEKDTLRTARGLINYVNDLDEDDAQTTRTMVLATKDSFVQKCMRGGEAYNSRRHSDIKSGKRKAADTTAGAGDQNKEATAADEDEEMQAQRDGQADDEIEEDEGKTFSDADVLDNTFLLKGTRAAHPSVIIADEGHHFKNKDSLQSDLVWNLFAGEHTVLVFATATPFRNNVADLAGLLRFCYRHPKKIWSTRENPKRFEEGLSTLKAYQVNHEQLNGRHWCDISDQDMCQAEQFHDIPARDVYLMALNPDRFRTLLQAHVKEGLADRCHQLVPLAMGMCILRRSKGTIITVVVEGKKFEVVLGREIPPSQAVHVEIRHNATSEALYFGAHSKFTDEADGKMFVVSDDDHGNTRAHGSVLRRQLILTTSNTLNGILLDRKIDSTATAVNRLAQHDDSAFDFIHRFTKGMPHVNVPPTRKERLVYITRTSPKLLAAIRYVKQHIIDNKEKIIFWYNEPLTKMYLETTLHLLGIKTVTIAAAMTQAERSSAEDKFNDDDTTMAMIISSRTGSESANLQYGGHIQVVMDYVGFTWLNQMLGRSVRIGQTHAIMMYILVLDESIDQYLQHDYQARYFSQLCGTIVPPAELVRQVVEEMKHDEAYDAEGAAASNGVSIEVRAKNKVQHCLADAHLRSLFGIRSSHLDEKWSKIKDPRQKNLLSVEVIHRFAIGGKVASELAFLLEAEDKKKKEGPRKPGDADPDEDDNPNQELWRKRKTVNPFGSDVSMRTDTQDVVFAKLKGWLMEHAGNVIATKEYDRATFPDAMSYLQWTVDHTKNCCAYFKKAVEDLQNSGTTELPSTTPQSANRGHSRTITGPNDEVMDDDDTFDGQALFGPKSRKTSTYGHLRLPERSGPTADDELDEEDQELARESGVGAFRPRKTRQPRRRRSSVDITDQIMEDDSNTSQLSYGDSDTVRKRKRTLDDEELLLPSSKHARVESPNGSGDEAVAKSNQQVQVERASAAFARRFREDLDQGQLDRLMEKLNAVCGNATSGFEMAVREAAKYEPPSSLTTIAKRLQSAWEHLLRPGHCSYTAFNSVWQKVKDFEHVKGSKQRDAVSQVLEALCDEQSQKANQDLDVAGGVGLDG